MRFMLLVLHLFISCQQIDCFLFCPKTSSDTLCLFASSTIIGPLSFPSTNAISTFTYSFQKPTIPKSNLKLSYTQTYVNLGSKKSWRGSLSLTPGLLFWHIFFKEWRSSKALKFFIFPFESSPPKFNPTVVVPQHN